MNKQLVSLFAALFISSLSHATADSNQGNTYSQNLQSDSKKGNDEAKLIAQDRYVSPKSDPRWDRKKAGRALYRQGGSDYPYKDSSDRDGQKTSRDDRDKKDRSSRQ